MKTKFYSFFGVAVLSLVLFSCNSGPKITRTDTPRSGHAKILVDETFAPVVQEQIDVYHGTYPDAFIKPIYTSEYQALNLFLKDSVRVLISTRKLTADQQQLFKERRRYVRTVPFAVDGVALIVNKQNKDTLLSVSALKDILTGKTTSWSQIDRSSKLGPIAFVFDRPNSSTSRFLKDSVCRSQPMSHQLMACANDSVEDFDLHKKTPSQQVIDYVASTPNAIGVIGVNWISNPNDSSKLSFINSIKVVSVSREAAAKPGNSYKPFQAYIALDKYPLTRNIFAIISDVRGGLPSGFVNFVGGDKGQRIVYKAGLLPATAPTRLVQINERLK